MLVSRCHNEEVRIAGVSDSEGWYECKKCNLPCETRISFLLDEQSNNVLCETFEEKEKDATI